MWKMMGMTASGMFRGRMIVPKNNKSGRGGNVNGTRSSNKRKMKEENVHGSQMRSMAYPTSKPLNIFLTHTVTESMEKELNNKCDMIVIK
jgi:hypothetical protein